MRGRESRPATQLLMCLDQIVLDLTNWLTLGQIYISTSATLPQTPPPPASSCLARQYQSRTSKQTPLFGISAAKCQVISVGSGRKVMTLFGRTNHSTELTGPIAYPTVGEAIPANPIFNNPLASMSLRICNSSSTSQLHATNLF